MKYLIFFVQVILSLTANANNKAISDCKEAWSGGRFKTGLPSKVLESRGIISIDVLTTVNGAKVNAYYKCDAKLHQGRKLFLLIPDGNPPIEATGDLTKVAGDTCPKADVGDGSYVEVKSSQKISAQQQAFLLLVPASEHVKDLKLTYQQFEKVNVSLCPKPKYQTTVFRTKEEKVTYFSQTTPECDWQYFGVVKDSKCVVFGKTILDCPAVGPTGEGIYGPPQKMFSLNTMSESEDYILTDSTLGEYHGSSIGRFEGDRLIEVRRAYEDSCFSH